MAAPLDGLAAVRASDSERERVVGLLRDAAAEGRLTLAELEERSEAALLARTRAELEPLTADLPERARRPPASRGRTRTARAERLLPYVAVNLVLIVVWAATGAGYPWFVWPLLGWGVALLAPGGSRCGSRHRRHTGPPLARR